MCKRTYILFFSLLLGLFPDLLSVEIPARAAFVRTISTREGLSNNSILSLGQDPAGRIWLGTCEGLSIWDGTRMDVYSTQPESGLRLSGNLIERIHVCRGLGTWIVTDYGLDMVEIGGKVRHFTQFKGMYRLVSWKKPEGCAVLTQAGHLYHFDGEAFQEARCPSVLQYDSFLASHPSGSVLFTRKGIYTGDILSDSLTIVIEKELLFVQSNDEEAFVVGNDGVLYRFDYMHQRLEYLTDIQEEVRARGEIKSIVRDGEDLYIAFLFNGVTRLVFQPDKAHQYRRERLPIDCGVFDLLKDEHQDILWIATDGYGLKMYAKVPYNFYTYLYEQMGGDFSTPVRALCKDRFGDLWVGTKGEGLIRLKSFQTGVPLRDLAHELYLSEFSDPAIFALTESRNNLLWIGSEGKGIDYFSYTDQKIHHLEGQLREDLRYIHSFYESDEHTLWAASVGKGVFRIGLSGGDHPTAVSCRKLDFGPLPNDSEFYFAMMADTDSTLWIGSRGSGLIHYFPQGDSTRVYTLDVTGTPAANDIWSVYRDSKGTLWTGTGSGLFRMEGGCFKGTSVLNLVHSILEGEDGRLYLGTNNGLIRYTPESNYALRLSYTYGLKTLEFSDGAAFADNQGLLYFGATNGFTVVQWEGGEVKDVTPPLTITALFKNGERIPLFESVTDTGLTIEAGDRLNAVELSATDFINEENFRYEYQVVERGEKWTESEAIIILSSLAPGEYHLNFRYKNPGTGYESPITTLHLTILAPFYRTTTAVAIYSLLAIALILVMMSLIARYNARKYEKKIKDIEKMQKEQLHDAQLKLMRDFATQIERPSLMMEAPIHQILSYSRADSYITACAENARHYNEKINHTLHLFRELTSEEEISQPDMMVFSPASTLSDMLETYTSIARNKKVIFATSIPKDLLWTGCPRTFMTFTDMLLTNLFFHVAEGKSITLDIHTDEQEEQLILDFTLESDWPDVELYQQLSHENFALEYIQNHLRKSLTIQDEMRLVLCYQMISSVGGSMRVNRERETSLFHVIAPKREIEETSASIGPVAETPQPEPYHSPSAQLLLKTELPDNPLPGPDMHSMFALCAKSEIRKALTLLFQHEFNLHFFKQTSELSEALESQHPDIIICELMAQDTQTETLILSLKKNKETVKIPVILIAEEQGDLPADAWATLPLNAKSLKQTVEQNLRRVESLKEYFSSQVSIYEFSDGKKLHREDKEFLEKLYRVIRSRLQDSDLTTSAIADEMNMSLRSLYSRMSGIINVTPSAIIREYRLAYAAQMLLKTKLTTAEIIWQSGFANRGTFFKNFLARYGCTPKEYRQRNGVTEEMPDQGRA